MPWLRIVFLFVVTFTAYSFMLSSPFKTLDDNFSIVSNKTIRNSSQWPALFSQGYFKDHSYYRPLANLSYLIEFHFFKLNAFYYNLDNVLIHIANAFLVWILVAYLMNAQAAFWVALLFAIHPIQWESVANISGRAILLGTFFSLAAAIFYFKGRQVFALICFGLALLSKESSAILPGILLAHALLNKRQARGLIAWGLVIAAYIGLRHFLKINEVFPWSSSQEFLLGFLTFLRSLLTDFRLFILPYDLYFDRSLPMFLDLTQPQAIATVLIWSSLLVFLAIYRKYFNSTQWLCLIWFTVSMLPVSQIVTTIGVQPGVISCAEHFLYFASIPVFMLMVQAILPLKQRAIKLICAGFLIFFFFITIEQNIYAQSELAMMERSLRHQPHNARLQSSVGLIFALSDKFPQAQARFQLAVLNDPRNPRYRISLGKSLCDQGKIDICLAVYNGIADPGGFRDLLAENKKAAMRLLKQ